MDVQVAILARPACVINEPQLAELIHEETDAPAGGADRLRQHFLTDFVNDSLQLALLPKVGQHQQTALVTTYVRERLIDDVLTKGGSGSVRFAVSNVV